MWAGSTVVKMICKICHIYVVTLCVTVANVSAICSLIEKLFYLDCIGAASCAKCMLSPELGWTVITGDIGTARNIV